MGNQEVAERRAEHRTTVELYFNIQVQTDRFTRVYDFKIQDSSSRGMRIVVDKDSDAFQFMEIGQIIGMRLTAPRHPLPAALMKCQIKHVTPITDGGDERAVIVGLLIL